MFPFLMQPNLLEAVNQMQATTQRMPQVQENISPMVEPAQQDLTIDTKKLEENESNKQKFYVPFDSKEIVPTPLVKRGGEKAVLGESGVSIVRGFDLGQIKTPERLDSILNRIPDETMRSTLRQQFLPFLGLKKEDAVQALKEQTALGNTKIDLRAMKPLNDAVLAQYKDDTADRYFNATGFNMGLLEPNEQQVLFEIHYQTLDPDKSSKHINVAPFNRIASALSIGDTKEAIKQIKAHPQYKKYRTRWNKYIRDLQ
jgi:hypothetical protein